MTYCNFPIIDEPLKLNDSGATFLVIENIPTYSRILYNLYQRSNGIKTDFDFLIFDDSFEELNNILVVQSPLSFDFNTTSIKKSLFDRIITTLDLDERQRIETSYGDLVQYFNQQIFEDIEIEVSISEVYKLEDLFKLLKINILDNSSNIFERTQLILNVLHEMVKQDLIVFCGLSMLLSEDELNLVVEAANLNQQRVLFLENHVVDNLKNTKQICVDKDYFCTEKMV